MQPEAVAHTAADIAEVEAAVHTAAEGVVAASCTAAAARIVALVVRIGAVAGTGAAVVAGSATDSAAFAAEAAWEGQPPQLPSPFRRRTDILFARAEHRARIEGISS